MTNGPERPAESRISRGLEIGQARPLTIEQRIEQIVEQTIERVLAPYLIKLSAPEPLVYTVSQTATVLQVSDDTVARLVRRGVLERVPHVEGKMLIPKSAVNELLQQALPPAPDVGPTNVSPLPLRVRRRASGP